MPNTSTRLKKPLLATLLVAICLIAVAAIAALYLLNSKLPEYRGAIEHRISQAIDAPVHIDALGLRWRWSGPVLRLTGVHIKQRKPRQVELDIPAIGLQFSLLDLVSGQRLPQAVVIRSPHFNLRTNTQHWLQGTQPSDFNWNRIANIRSVIDAVAIKDARIDITLISPAGRQEFHLTQVDAAIRDDGNALRLTASATGRPWLDTIELQAAVSGPLPDFSQARLSLNIDGLSLPTVLRQWASQRTDRTLTGGITHLQAQSSWQAGQFDHATVRVDTNALQAGPNDPALLPALKAQITATADPKQPHVIHMSLASLTSASPALVGIDASARLDTGKPALTIRAGHIAAALFEPFLRQTFASLQAVDLSGSIKAAEMTWAPDQALRSAIAFKALNISTKQFSAGPVSGHYYRNGDNNVVRFTGADGNVRLARYIKGALPVNNLGGQLGWQTTSHGLQLRATNLKLTSGASTMTLSGQLILPDQGAPIADLTTHIETPDCAVLLAHVPQAKDMPFDRLRDWLPKAIDACNVTVDGTLSGPLDQMFAEQGQHLRITIAGSDFALEYKPDWPRLTDANGTIRLVGDTMDIDISKGQMLGVNVGPVTIHVDDVRDPVLFLDGTVSDGSAPKMLSFLAQSPLRDRFGTLVDVLDITGTAGLDLSLRLPLKDDLGEIKVSGVIHTQGNTVKHEALPAPIQSLRGDIHFSKQGLRAKTLHATLMGVALTTRITPAAAHRINIISQGRVSLPQNKALLNEYLPEQWLAFAHGSARVQAQLQIDMRGAISGFRLQSDLKGLALTLPQPFGKSADSATAFSIGVHDGGRVTLAYADTVRVDMHFDGRQLQRAIIRLGGNTATATSPAPTGDGFWLGGHISTLPIFDWGTTLQQLAGADHKANAKQPSALPFLGADLAIDTLRMDNRVLSNVHVNVDRQPTTGGWHIAVTGPTARGQATWQATTGAAGSRLRANFARLYIKTKQAPPETGNNKNANATSADSSLLDINPQNLPTVNITIDDLRIGSTHFGTAHIKAAAIDEGWRLHKASLSGGALTLAADGRWTRHVGLTEAQLGINIEGHGVAQLTRALGFEPAIHANHVAIHGNLKFAPNDHGLSLAALNGKLSLTLKDGAIKSIEPGAGRLLGLFNLYALPRRLTFDFSDVIGEGLAFDLIAGNFEIISGDAFTNDLIIQTPSATIKIVGRIGLATRDYDQTVTIIPKIGSGLTLAGTLLGGPAIGAAVFALQELLETPFENASSIVYQLQGSWGDPSIVNAHAKE